MNDTKWTFAAWRHGDACLAWCAGLSLAWMVMMCINPHTRENEPCGFASPMTGSLLKPDTAETFVLLTGKGTQTSSPGIQSDHRFPKTRSANTFKPLCFGKAEEGRKEEGSDHQLCIPVAQESPLSSAKTPSLQELYSLLTNSFSYGLLTRESTTFQPSRKSCLTTLKTCIK